MLRKADDLFPPLQVTVDTLVQEFDKIPEDRRRLLNEMTTFIRRKEKTGEKIALNFICTHNSRRSHIAQLWGQVAAHYFDIQNVECLSGGTEATAFNPRAVKAMRAAGFDIRKMKDGDNPVYEVKFARDLDPIVSFSKKYDDAFNQRSSFAAIMTCSHADENCPLVSGAASRIAITYADPKDFDGTSLEETTYHERVHQIGREMLFAFSQVRT
jgi:arsenate reductase